MHTLAISLGKYDINKYKSNQYFKVFVGRLNDIHGLHWFQWLTNLRNRLAQFHMFCCEKISWQKTARGDMPYFSSEFQVTVSHCQEAKWVLWNSTSVVKSKEEWRHHTHSHFLTCLLLFLPWFLYSYIVQDPMSSESYQPYCGLWFLFLLNKQWLNKWNTRHLKSKPFLKF